MLDAELLMQRALELALAALDRGEPPFAALVATMDSGRVVASVADQVLAHRDWTRHAETEAIRLAVSRCGPDLSNYVLVTTVEPCAMCFTAAWLARIRRIYYGATMAAVATRTQGRQRELPISADQINRWSGSVIDLIGGIGADACLAAFSPDVVPVLK
jgi:tRNA(adenine34) deaminase